MTRFLPLLLALVLTGCSQDVPDTLDIVPGGEDRLEALLESVIEGADWENQEGGGGGSSDFVEYSYVFQKLRCSMRFVVVHEFDARAMAHVTVHARR